MKTRLSITWTISAAGGVDAVMAMPGALEAEPATILAIRLASCAIYAVIVLALLYWDKA